MLRTALVLSSLISYGGVNAYGDLPQAQDEQETIYLESRFVGDKSQVSVSHFIPWEGTQSADYLKWHLAPRPGDNSLNLVDRKIMLRSMEMYDGMTLERPE